MKLIASSIAVRMLAAMKLSDAVNASGSICVLAPRDPYRGTTVPHPFPRADRGTVLQTMLHFVLESNSIPSSAAVPSD